VTAPQPVLAGWLLLALAGHDDPGDSARGGPHDHVNWLPDGEIG
jgi:hypothetical protein